MKEIQKSTWWIYAVVTLALLPMLLLRDYTPDNELRYLSIVDEAIGRGSIWCFHNHGLAYADKPPLYFWLMMGARWLCGSHCMFAYALFSFIPMLLIGRIMTGMTKHIFTIRQRQTALLLLFTCAFFPVMGVTVRMDMLMTLWIVLAMREVWRMAKWSEKSEASREADSLSLGATADNFGRGRRYRHGALLGLYTFLALFTKGPYGVLFPLLASLVWLLAEKKGKLFFWIWNWAAWLVLLAGCAMWFGGVWLEGGNEYLDNLLFHQTVDRARNAFHHKRPFWFYAVAIWYVMAPWSLLMLWQAIRRHDLAFSTPFRKMTLLTLATIFVIISCVSSKLPIYLLPAIPFAIYWCASLPIGEKLEKVVRVTAWILLGIVFVGGCAIPWINPYFGYGTAAREAKDAGAKVVLIDESVKRGENIDAYLGAISCKIVNSNDSTFTLPAGAALIVKDKPKKLKVIYEQDR